MPMETIDSDPPDLGGSRHRSTKLLTSWKLWASGLIVGLLVIAASICIPSYRRWQAIEYLDRERISSVKATDVRWLERWIGEAANGFIAISGVHCIEASEQDVLILAEFDELQRLDYGSLPPRSLSSREVDALTSLTTLDRIRLNGLRMSDRELAEWIASCPNLTSIQLINAGASVETVRAIAGRPSIVSLTIQNETDRDAVSEDSRALAPLQFVERGPFETKYLYLEGVPMADDFLADWIASCPQLIHVELFEAGADVQTLRAVSKLPHVTKLSLQDVALSDDDFAVMQAMPLLKELWLGGSAITGEGIVSFVDSKDIDVLWMNGASISEEGFAQIARLSNLEELFICDCPNVRPSGIAALASMPHLEGIVFTPEMITPEIVEALHHLPVLKYVDIVGWPLDEELISAIEEHWEIGWK